MARHILQQRTITMNNFSGTLLSNYLPNWLQWAAIRSGGSSSSPPELHVHAVWTTSPWTYSLSFCRLLSPLPPLHDSQAGIPTSTTNSWDRISTPCCPWLYCTTSGVGLDHYSLLSYPTHEGHNTIPFHHQNPAALWCFEPAAEGVTQKIQQFPTWLQCKLIQELQGNALASVMLFCLMLCGAVGSSDLLSLPLRLSTEIKRLWGHGSLWVGGN